MFTKLETTNLGSVEQEIKGNEPYLSYWSSGVTVQFQSGPSTHVLCLNHPVNLSLKTGDVLSVNVFRHRVIPTTLGKILNFFKTI